MVSMVSCWTEYSLDCFYVHNQHTQILIPLSQGLSSHSIPLLPDSVSTHTSLALRTKKQNIWNTNPTSLLGYSYLERRGNTVVCIGMDKLIIYIFFTFSTQYNFLPQYIISCHAHHFKCSNCNTILLNVYHLGALWCFGFMKDLWQV